MILSNATGMYYGSNPISKMYLGSTIVWDYGISPGDQLLDNDSFSLGSQSWSSSTGLFQEYSTTAGTSPAIENGALFFSSVERTVSQTANILDIATLDQFQASINIKKNDTKTSQQSLYYFTVTFKNAINGTVFTLRSPASGNSLAPSSSTTVSSTVTREDVGASFNTITKVTFSITARETTGAAGNFGPQINFAKLIAS